MSNQQTKEQEKRDCDRALKELGDFAAELRKQAMEEAMRQDTEDQRKVIDKWTANAQDPNKIYWKG